MKIDKRLETLEEREEAIRWRYDSATYKEGYPIQYDGLTFHNERDLIAYGKTINTHILPVCIVNSRNKEE
jgi:hypothetical protein